MYPNMWITLSLMHFPELFKNKTNITDDETNGAIQACESKQCQTCIWIK